MCWWNKNYFFDVWGPCIVNIFQIMTNKMQRYTVFYLCELPYMFQVDPPTHHQEHNTVSRASGICQTVTATCRCRGRVGNADTFVCAPDDGWRYHPKHVEQFPDINKLCYVASCWIYIRIYLRCADPWMLNTEFLNLTQGDWKKNFWFSDYL